MPKPKGNISKSKKITSYLYQYLPVTEQSLLFMKAHIRVLSTKVHTVSTKFSLALIAKIRPALLSLYTSKRSHLALSLASSQISVHQLLTHA